jgi:hypothetical protein
MGRAYRGGARKARASLAYQVQDFGNGRQSGEALFCAATRKPVMPIQQHLPYVPYACWAGAFTGSDMGRIETHGDLAKRRKLSVPLPLTDPSPKFR